MISVFLVLLVALVFSPYLLPISNARFRGRGSSFKGRQLFSFGDMSAFDRSIHFVIFSSTCHPNLGFLLILCPFLKKLSCVF